MQILNLFFPLALFLSTACAHQPESGNPPELLPPAPRLPKTAHDTLSDAFFVADSLQYQTNSRFVRHALSIRQFLAPSVENGPFSIRLDPDLRNAIQGKALLFLEGINRDTAIFYLNHPCARVRAYALCALHFNPVPENLPLIHAMFADTAACYRYPPAPKHSEEYLSNIGRSPSAFEMELREKAGATVRVQDIAQRILNVYLQPGYGPEAFSAFWAPRSQLNELARVWKVKFDFTCQPLFHLYPEYEQEIQKTKRALALTSRSFQQMFILYYSAWRWDQSEPVFSATEVLAACRALGRKNLMRILEDRPVIPDPDFTDPDFADSRRRLILTLGWSIIQPADTAVLRDFANSEMYYGKSTEWAIATARLNPRKAPERLHEAVDVQTARDSYLAQALLCATLWELCGRKESNYIRKWYSELPVEAGKDARQVFTELVRACPDNSILNALK